MIRIYSIVAFFLQLCVVFFAVLVAHRSRQHTGQVAPSDTTSVPAGTGSMRAQLLYRLLVVVVIAAGILLRFYKLGVIPYGLNNDEASIGYDAWALATYGIDRNGYPWPVYPITWGSGGGGPMVVYLAVLTEKLIGHSVFSLRLPSAILGVLTLPLFYLLLKKAFGAPAALAGLVFLAFNPWHLLMSRFALDCNTFAFWLTAALVLFLAGVKTYKTAFYLFSAALFAACLYVYGSATIVIPVFLLLIALHALHHGDLTLRQLIMAIAVFLFVLLPLIVFYAINFLDLPAIVTAHFSIPRFITSRSVFYAFDASLPMHMGESLLYLLRFLTTGPLDTEVTCNQVPGYGVFYRFTFLLTGTGLILSVRHVLRGLKKQKEEDYSPVCSRTEDILLTGNLILFICAAVFSLFLRLEISRMTLFLVPVIIFQAIALRFLLKYTGRTGYAIVLLSICLGALLFTRNYFGIRYQTTAEENFMMGYGDAVLYAQELWEERAGSDTTASDTAQASPKIISTYRHVAAPFAVVLYYTETPVQEFIDTAIYREDDGEALIALAFTHFVFGLPDDLREDDYADDILILHKEDLEQFSSDDYEITPFRNYAVAVKAQ